MSSTFPAGFGPHFASGGITSAQRTNRLAATPALSLDSVRFSSRHNDLPQSQPGIIRKYAWPATLITMGGFLGLTGAIFAWTGIGFIGHIAGLGLLALGLHKGWKAFRQTESALPQYHHEHALAHDHTHTGPSFSDNPPAYSSESHGSEHETTQPERSFGNPPTYTPESRTNEHRLDPEAEPPNYPR